MKQQKLILVSLDALTGEDLEQLKDKPCFSHILKNGAWVKQMRSIYPTLTYPCHATMATGCWPAKHGILNNQHFVPGDEDPVWLWYHDAFKVKDLIDAAKEKGLTTAAVGWPTMGCHPHADYIVAEVAGPKNRTAEEFVRDYLATGSTPEVWEAAGAPHLHFRLRPSHPSNVSWFNANAALELIRKYQPDLLILHCAAVDSAKHLYGAYNEAIRESVEESEEILAGILNAVREAGIEDVTNIVITADHGQIDATQMCHPNVLLARHGFVEVDENGTVTDWRAWSLSTGMCTEVYVKNKEDEAAVFELLRANEDRYGWEKVFTREETAKHGFDGPFSFVLETDGVTKFGNKWLGEVTVPFKAPMGGHGYYPDKGPDPLAIGYGPAFRQGAVLEQADLVDGAPTWARILGAELPDADGRVLEELLK